jgi:nucleotide sugar dehydrogenase
MQNSWPDFNPVSSIVAVIGLGKIGLPLAVQYARHGCRVIGCDINPEVVEMVNAGESHVQEETGLAAEVASMVEEGLLSATVHTVEAVQQSNVVVIIVPVVVDTQHQVNFTGIDATTEVVGTALQPGTLVIYETTLPVGTTSSRLRHILERASNLQAGQDFFLAYSPERVSSGSIFRDLRIYPKVIGGIDTRSTGAAVAFYQSVLEADILTMSSADEAEFVKLIETTYRDVNIALANEFACFADMYSLDVSAAIAAANTQPYSHIHAPGVGVGGHCIPVYPYFLLAGIDKSGFHMPSSELPMLTLPRSARLINDAMAEYSVRRIEEILGSLEQESVLILGIAYRGDVRENAFTSAQLLQEVLLKHGATVYVDDPLFSEQQLEALGYTPFLVGREDEIGAIVLQAGHQSYQDLDFRRFTHCEVVLDGRRALNRERIEALGIRYVAIGDGRRKEQRHDGDGGTTLAPSMSQIGGHR